MSHSSIRRALGRAALSCAAVAMLSACALSPEEEAAAIEEGIMSTPNAGELWRTVKAEYPDDFAALVAQVQALDASERSDEERVKEIGAEWLQDFFTKIGADTVKAPAAELIALSAAEAELYKTLQRGEVDQCAAMAMGSWVFIDPGNAVAASAIARRNTAMVKAAAAGRSDPQSYSEPSEGAFQQLGDSIAATGIDPNLQAALSSDAQMMALSTEDQCTLGVAVYTGLSNLDDAVEPTMAAYMLAPE